MYSLELQGSDLVLGMQWLQTLGLVLHDWKNLMMQFEIDKRQYFLKGETTMRVAYESIHSLQQLMANGLETILMQITGVTNGNAPEFPDSTAAPTTAPNMAQLLVEYHSIFQNPSLPPMQAHDHQINLEAGANPVNVCPYRYPHIQKNEIERAMKEMLTTGIIRPSNSSFSSSVLLVKKKDGSWRFCIDYRALNKAIVKDRYPILVIDELLDELHGAFFFFLQSWISSLVITKFE